MSNYKYNIKKTAQKANYDRNLSTDKQLVVLMLNIYISSSLKEH